MALPLAVHAQTYSKTEVITYHDNTSRWVLGQVSKRIVNGITETEIGYSSYAQPLTFKSFGKLVETRTHDVTTAGQMGTIKTIKDGRGNITTLANWKRGIPQKITYADGKIQAAVVNNDGTIASVTDENGYKTCYAYDAMGRLSKITYPSESTTGVCDATTWTATTLDFSVKAGVYGLPNHWRRLERTGNGYRITRYDALWRPVVEESYDNGDSASTRSIVVKRYDAAGRLAFQSYPVRTLGSWTDTSLKGVKTTYDALGRVTKVAQDSELGVLTTTTSYLSNANGYYTQVTDPKGNQTRTWYQAFDQPSYDTPVTIWHPEGVYTHISRDIFGKPTRIRRSNSSSATGGTVALDRSYAYNANHELCRTVEPETGATLMGYDAAGNLAWSAAGLPASTACHATGGTTTISPRRAVRTYDARNRISSLSFPDSRGNTTHSYWPDGLPKLIEADNGDGNIVTTSYQYNRRRLPIREQMDWGSLSWYITHGYNPNGHKSSQSQTGGLSVSYAPNALGQPTQVGTYATDVTYHPNGAIARFNYGNGISHRMDQNVRGLPEWRIDFRGSSFRYLNDYYDYDQNGNVLAISDALPGNNGDRDMTYDGLDRLKTVTAPQMFGTATYAYDALDNLTRVNVTAGSAPRNHYYCYDNSWRLTNVKTGSCSGTTVVGLGYDEQGNLEDKNGTAFDFDYGNRLRSASGGGVSATTYAYDGLGRRVRDFTGGSKYSLYSQAGQLAFDNDLRKKRQHSYVYLGNRLIAVRERDTETGTYAVKYQHVDALGSPVAVTDENRVVTEHNKYEPYGKVNRPLKDGPGYTGHVEDAATGLIYAQQRYYDDDIGRFLSVDPVAADGNTGNHFNRYRYADNNPYRYTDPDGRCANLCTGAIGAGVGAFVGFAVEGVSQIRQGSFNGRALLVETGKGAVVGGLIGLTGGAAALPSSGLTLGGQAAATSSVALGVGTGAHAIGEVAKGNAAPSANESIKAGYAAAAGAAVGTAAGPLMREATTSVTPAVSSHPVTSLSGRVFNTVNTPAQVVAAPKAAETAAAASAAVVEDQAKRNSSR